MLRNIDFDALRSLRDRHGAAFPRGRVIFRENDTSAEFYVVLQGSVELSIKDPKTGNKNVLIVVPPGGFFGEMSCFSSMPRSATAIAAEDSVLLFFNQDTAIQLMRASPRFALGVIQTLCDRIRNNNERIARLTALVGDAERSAAARQPPAAGSASSASSVLARGAATAASAARPTAGAGGASVAVRDVPPPNYNKQLLWGKSVVCPVSNTRFMALNVRPEAATVVSRESDFREIVQGPNPLWHLVYVCPDCLYAAYPDDFASASAEEIATLAPKRDARRQGCGGVDFAGERGRDEAIQALRLAIDCYTLRAPNRQRLGGLYHRLAWLYREAGDATTERGYLAQAMEHYQAALDQEKPEGAVELTLIYTIGDLYLRLGNPAESVKWLVRASQHAEFRRQPDIQRLLRERWGDARAAARTNSPSPEAPGGRGQG